MKIVPFVKFAYFSVVAERPALCHAEALQQEACRHEQYTRSLLALALCAATSVAIGGAPAPVLAQTAAPAPDPERDATRRGRR